jgi:type II secretory pathway pseudopilin PulG
LLEVVVALAVLATAGVALLQLANQAQSGLVETQRTVEQFSAAEQLAGQIEVWTRDELIRRLGYRRNGIWYLNVNQTSGVVFHIAILDSLQRPVLTTAVLRP